MNPDEQNQDSTGAGMPTEQPTATPAGGMTDTPSPANAPAGQQSASGMHGEKTAMKPVLVGLVVVVVLLVIYFVFF